MAFRLRVSFASLILLLFTSGFGGLSLKAADGWAVGASKKPIDADRAVRLSGYGNRSTPTDQVDDHLFVRSMAMKHGEQKPLVMVSLDAIGLSAMLTDRICDQAKMRFGIERPQLVLCTTHSHTAPQLVGVLTNLLSTSLTETEQESSQVYTDKLIETTLETIGEALGKLQPASVTFGTGRAGFAINRRVLNDKAWVNFGTVEDGPVDRTVRVIQAKSLTGKTIAIAYQYACHCTSISPDLNRISADWAGLSASTIEETLTDMSGDKTDDTHPIALPIIGCGADANPNPRGLYEHAKSHGAEMAKSVLSICGQQLQELPAPTVQTFELVALASDVATPEQLQKFAESTSATERNYARIMLETKKRKGRLPETYPAPIHLWNFGSTLAWVFLGGEVVVDYQIRLERELSQFPNVWVASYVDDVFGYVASERVRNEGGYEVDGSMIYYSQPGRWSSGTEEVLVSRVIEMANQKRSANQSLSAEESLASIEMPKGWNVELVAAEPLIADPVNFAFGADGTIWVLEMGDYPTGGSKTGRVKKLIDTDGDGKIDTSHVFLDNLSYPSGIYAWKDGIVLACAPDVFVVYDRDHDHMADEKRVLLTGFHLANPQHRVNGFTYGLDHRLHFPAGDQARDITEVASGKVIRVEGHDLSLDVDTGRLYLESGTTQFIRACDEWGNWFGNDNSHPLYHFVWQHDWLQHGNARVQNTTQHAMQPPTAPPVFPVSRQADRYNDLFASNRFTSACSSILCYSPGAPDDMQGCALICESVHNLVSRIQLSSKGSSFLGVRFEEDTANEWLRSSDPWFRPVRIQNAPDGTIWVADMVRRVIEHPEWIPDDWQKRIDLRAGEDQGRLYRVYRSDFTPYQNTDWTKAELNRLLEALQMPSVAVADFARQQLIFRANDLNETNGTVSSELRKLFASSESPQVRLRALATLSSMGICTADDWKLGCSDSDARVVRWAIEKIARLPNVDDSLRQALVDATKSRVAKESPAVALHLIAALAAMDRPANSEIAHLLAMHAGDKWINATVNLVPRSGIDEVIEGLLASSSLGTEEMIDAVIPNASNQLKSRLRNRILTNAGPRPAWHFSLGRQLALETDGTVRMREEDLTRLIKEARLIIQDMSADPNTKQAALELINTRLGPKDHDDHAMLVNTLVLSNDTAFCSQLIRIILNQGKTGSDTLFSNWEKLPDSTRGLLVSSCVGSELGARSLLEYLEKGTINRESIQPSHVEQLRSLESSELQVRVTSAFGPPPGADRAAIVGDFTRQWPASAGMDLALGERLYKQHCSQCHQERTARNEIVSAIGPDLRSLSGWKNDAWITAIIDPNRAVEPKYRRTQIRTVDGQTLVGLKVGETQEFIDVVNDQGQFISILKKEIDEVRESEKSLMPEGFENILKPNEVASIVTFLRKQSATTTK